MSADTWIIVEGWGRFQHRDVLRSEDTIPAWIKVYTKLMHNPDFDDLTLVERGLLLTIWLEFAASDGQLRVSDVTRSGRFRANPATGSTLARVKLGTLEALAEAGFITLTASRPPKQSAGLEKRREEENPPNPPAQPRGGKRGITKKDLRGYTGCKVNRGSHGFGYVHRVLGRDEPPADWPHPRPTETDVRIALATQWVEDELGGSDEDEAKAMVVKHFGVNGDNEIALLDRAADLRSGR